MKKPIFTGAGVAIITPFFDGADGGINYDEFAKIIEHQLAHHTDAIIICGTTGEASTLTDEEHRAAIKFCIDQVKGRVPVIAGTGSNDTAYAIDLSKYAADAGADAVLTVTPYYNKTSQRGLVQHFTAIADASKCPLVLYNVPSRTGMSFTPETYFELSKHPNINGVKEASGNFSMIAEAMDLCGDALNFWSGNDDQIVPLMSLGGYGVISVLSNVAPEESHNITEACLKGDFQTAAKLQKQYMKLINALFCETNPIPVKAAMNELGWKAGGLRMPLFEISDTHREILKKELQAAGCKI